MSQTYFIRTFGCQQNEADSEKIARFLEEGGKIPAESDKDADYVVINTCMIRQMAEDRIYGYVHNLDLKRKSTGKPKKIIITGCLVGLVTRDKSGKYMKFFRKKLPQVDGFIPIEEMGLFGKPLRKDKNSALVPISSGCNNFCTYCVVPFTRGRERSRPFIDILQECRQLCKKGYRKITLLGMNVNSYGADLVHTKTKYILPNGKSIKPVLVSHLGRKRIPTLFPYLLEEIAKINDLDQIDFLSSNPWDFSNELIQVIADNPKISRIIHLPVQSGSNRILKKMNRWYTADEYLQLLRKIRASIPEVNITTDIIVGFCSETENDFLKTVNLAKKARFKKAYIARYSPRPKTTAEKSFTDDVSHREKKRRWKILDDMINKSKK